MILISVDDHTVEPPDMFKNHLSKKYADDAPRLVHNEDGTYSEGTLAADLKVGIEMELTTMPLFVDDDGVERIVYAWRIA